MLTSFSLSLGVIHAFHLAGCPLRITTVAQEPGFLADGNHLAGAWHWRYDGCVQRRLRRAAPTVSLRRRRPHGPPRSENQERPRILARLHRTAISKAA